MAGVRSQDLTGLHRGDEVAALARGANVDGASGDLTELRRGTDTAGKLAALQDAMRGGEAGEEGEVRSVLRVSELDDTASVHEASALDIEADIRSGASAPGMDAPALHSAVSPPQPPPRVEFGLLGGADRPPQPAVPMPIFLEVYLRLRTLSNRFRRLGKSAIVNAFEGAIERISDRLLHQFKVFGGTPEELAQITGCGTDAESAYYALHKMARQADRDDKLARAADIREVLNVIVTGAIEELRWLSKTCGLAEFPPTQAMQRLPIQRPSMQRPSMQRPPVTGGPPVTVAPTSVALAGQLNIPGPAHHIPPAGTLAFPQPPGGLVHATDVPGPPPASSLPGPSLSEAGDHGRARLDQPATTAGQPTTTETIVTPALAGPTSFWLQPANPWPAPGSVPVDSGLHHASETVQPPPVTATASSTAPAPVAARPTGAGAVAPPPAADPRRIRPPRIGGGPRPVAFDPWSAPPGPSSQAASTETLPPRVMSTGAPPGWQGAETPGFGRAASGAVELPFSRREAIARWFRLECSLHDAELALQTGSADKLDRSDARVLAVLDDLYRLNGIGRWYSTATATMVDVDWHAIDALMSILSPPLLHRDAAERLSMGELPAR